MQKTIARFASLKVVSFVLNLAFSAVQLSIFGLASDLDIYFVATTFITVVISLTQTGQLGEFILPMYARKRREYGYKAAFREVNSVLLVVLLLTSIILVVSAYNTDKIGLFLFKQDYLSHDKLISRILLLSFPLIFLRVINSFYNIILNAESIYGRVEVVNSVNSLIGISLLLIFQWYGIKSILVLVINLYIGAIIEFIWSIVLLFKKGYRFRFVKLLGLSEIWPLFRTLSTTSMYTVATSMFNLLLASSVSVLPDGIFGAYSMSRKVFGKVEGVIVGPLVTVLFTEMNINDVVTDKIIKRLLPFVLLLPWLMIFVAVSVKLLTGTVIVVWVQQYVSNFEYMNDFIIIFAALLPLNIISAISRKIIVSQGGFIKVYNTIAGIQLSLTIVLYLVSDIMSNNLFLILVLLQKYLVLMVSVVIINHLKIVKLNAWQNLTGAVALGALLFLDFSPWFLFGIVFGLSGLIFYRYKYGYKSNISEF